MTDTYKKKISAPKSPGKWLVIICIFLSQLMFYTWVRVESTQTVFRISKARHDQKKAMAYQTALGLERARLISPQQISMIARTELGLVVPKPEQIIYLFGDNN
ncbi:MAG: hypothetical protein D3926_13260 [Desulfobacteraceae bacterium]|nr:MAG: hypothetical protein D3926_13260 [Desulfobacteraceae bacterium]